jgi:hypothetical protein
MQISLNINKPFRKKKEEESYGAHFAMKYESML